MVQAASQTSSEYINATARLNQGLQKFYIYLGFIRRAFGPPFTFQKLVIIIGIIALIVMLSMVATAFYALNKKRMHPPSIAECPDYFESTGKNKCKNTQKIGSCTEGEYDFSDSKYSGVEGNKEKYKKAVACNWEWDGITNNAKYTKVEGDSFE